MTIIWVFIVALILAIVQNFIFSRAGLTKINYNRSFSTPFAHQGDEVYMVEEISNNKILPVPWLKIESRMPKVLSFGRLDDLTISAEIYHRSLFFMGAYRKITRTHYVKCTKRGRCVLNSASISSGGLFGFMDVSQDLSMNASISIYPKLIRYNELPEFTKQILGEIIVKRWISPDPFLISGIRQYAQGDSLKDVHWGATAKTGSLKVKVHDFSASPNLLVLLNTEVSEKQWDVVMEEETQAIEYGISLAASVMIWAMKNGLKAGFGSNGYLCDDEEKNPIYLPHDGGGGGIRNMLETMSRIVISRRLTFFTYLDTVAGKIAKDMDLLILTSYVNARLDMQIKKLKSYGNNVSVQLIGKVTNYE